MTKIAPKTLAKRIVKIAWSKKAEDIVLLDLKKISIMADYFLVCSAGSEVQARVIAEAILDSLSDSGIKCSVEGLEGSRWILIDCYAVVVHVFLPEARVF